MLYVWHIIRSRHVEVLNAQGVTNILRKKPARNVSRSGVRVIEFLTLLLIVRKPVVRVFRGSLIHDQRGTTVLDDFLCARYFLNVAIYADHIDLSVAHHEGQLNAVSPCVAPRVKVVAIDRQLHRPGFCHRDVPFVFRKLVTMVRIFLPAAPFEIEILLYFFFIEQLLKTFFVGYDHNIVEIRVVRWIEREFLVTLVRAVHAERVQISTSQPFPIYLRGAASVSDNQNRPIFFFYAMFCAIRVEQPWHIPSGLFGSKANRARRHH